VGYNEWGLRQFLNSCSSRAVGVNWFRFVSQEPACVKSIVGLIENYHQQFPEHKIINPRYLDPIGGTSLSVLGISAVIENGARPFKEVAKKYFESPSRDIQPEDFNVFKNVRFAYFGNSRDLERVKEGLRVAPELQADYKMSRFMEVPRARWSEILAYSPAEPGLTDLTLPELVRSGTELGAEHLSTAGWADLHPSIVLKAMGCEKVLYIGRRGEEGKFLRGVVTQLGATVQDIEDLYSLKKSDSSISLSLKASDGVWCTDWNAADLQAPRLVEMDMNVADKVELSSFRPNVLRGLLLNPNASFAQRIKTPRFVGCGGSVAVPEGHTSDWEP
jgi:hypothetical protein